MWTTILSTLITKLPLGMLERWLTHLEKVGDTGTERLRLLIGEILETKKLQAQIIIAEQNKWYTAMIRPLFAWPIAIYMWKVIVYDKVLGLGTTDPLGDGSIAWAFTAIIGAYFIVRPFEKKAMMDKAVDTIKNWRK